MIVYEGRGGYAFVFFFFAVFGVGLVYSPVLGKSYTDYTSFWFAQGLVLAGLLSLYFGRKWNGSKQDRTTLDTFNGKPAVQRQKHTMYFIPLEYWGVIQLVAGPIVFVVGLLKR